uniref:Uncharacterized protein n=1 Tax=Myotis myotis TaxID=51298 RepID=A0A7J7VYW2_MYOMY|nr:hypothetical protein mMyoMyo1_012312 [Myotis myotis]
MRHPQRVSRLPQSNFHNNCLISLGGVSSHCSDSVSVFTILGLGGHCLPCAEILAIECASTWLEHCHDSGSGAMSLESLQLVNVSVQGSEQLLACLVQHEAHPHIWPTSSCSQQPPPYTRSLGVHASCLHPLLEAGGLPLLLSGQRYLNSQCPS